MARSRKEVAPLYPPVKSEVRRTQNDWWVKCPKDSWLPADTCTKSFRDVNALRMKSHHCFNCHNGKEYRIMFANGAFDRSFYDKMYGVKERDYLDPALQCSS